MAEPLTYAARYHRRRRYAVRHGLRLDRATLWALPPEAEHLSPRPTPLPRLYPAPPPGHSLLCCSGWVPITQTPVVCPGCGTRYLEGQP